MSLREKIVLHQKHREWILVASKITEKVFIYLGGKKLKENKLK